MYLVTFNKLNNFVNFDSLFTKLSRIDPCEKHIYILLGQAWLEAMAIYLVKQVRGNDKLACVYRVKNHKKYLLKFTHLLL